MRSLLKHLRIVAGAAGFVCLVATANAESSGTFDEVEEPLVGQAAPQPASPHQTAPQQATRPRGLSLVCSMDYSRSGFFYFSEKRVYIDRVKQKLWVEHDGYKLYYTLNGRKAFGEIVGSYSKTIRGDYCNEYKWVFTIDRLSLDAVFKHGAVCTDNRDGEQYWTVDKENIKEGHCKLVDDDNSDLSMQKF